MHKIDGGQHPLCFGHSSRGTGEGQGHPWGEGTVGGDDRVVVLVPETHRHATFVLALTASATVLVAVVVCAVVTAVLWLMRHVPVARRRLVSGVALSLGVALAAAGN